MIKPNWKTKTFEISKTIVNFNASAISVVDGKLRIRGEDQTLSLYAHAVGLFLAHRGINPSSLKVYERDILWAYNLIHGTDYEYCEDNEMKDHRSHGYVLRKLWEDKREIIKWWDAPFYQQVYAVEHMSEDKP